jgi:serine/threonine-protein kinase
MTPERWRQVTEIFHAALARHDNARDAFLRDACRDDPSLRADVDHLLAGHSDAGSFGETPVLSLPASPPRLEPGAVLGPYHIKHQLGAGGMGEVYAAEDSKLHRQVALKVLPRAASSDPERRHRLEREAQAIAALTHPNVVTLYSFEQAGDVPYLTMELVEGSTLSDLIPRDGLALDRLLEIAVPLADAVGAAHARGIVHRDLKPANVMVTAEGRVKVLDFGLAKFKETLVGEVSPVAASELTGEGRMVGTVAYVSPEQAEGRPVDHRSDIFSLGVVLFELATGRRPFTSDTSLSLLSAIVKDTPPPVTELKPELPKELARLIARCLAKDPGRRYQSAIDLRNELEEIKQDLESGALTPRASGTALAPGDRLRWRLVLTVSLIAASAIVVGYLVWSRPAGPAPPQVLRLTLQPPPGGRILDEGPSAPWLAMSPDGRWIAFTVSSDDPNRAGLYLRSTSELDPRKVGGGTSPFFSPDSKWLGFSAANSIQKIPVAGGQPQRICSLGKGRLILGASWADDGSIVFTSQLDERLWRVSADGGEPVVLTNPGPGEMHYFPQVLPGSKAALVTLITGLSELRRTVALVSLETGAILHKWFSGSSARYVSGGFLVFRHFATVYVAPFDLERLDVNGEPRPILEDVHYGISSGASAFDVSLAGALVYTPGAPVVEDRELVWLDRQGRTELVAPERRPYEFPALDYTGRRVAVHVGDGLGADLFVYDIDARSWLKLTQGLETLQTIVWSPDGKWIVSSSNRPYPKLFRVRADGTGNPQPLTDGLVWEYAGSIYGNVLMFSRRVRQGTFDLMTISLEPRGAPVTFLQTGFQTMDPSLSPDGRWVAYESAESGQGTQVFVRPYSEPSRFRKLVASFGWGPRWSRDGRSIFYRRDREIWVVPVKPGLQTGEFHAGTPHLVVKTEWLSPRLWRDAVELSPDGERFLVARRPALKERRLVYVPTWLDEVRDALRR